MTEQERKATLEGLIRGDLPVREARLRLGRFRGIATRSWSR
jgi:hypothetical protein